MQKGEVLRANRTLSRVVSGVKKEYSLPLHASPEQGALNGKSLQTVDKTKKVASNLQTKKVASKMTQERQAWKSAE